MNPTASRTLMILAALILSIAHSPARAQKNPQSVYEPESKPGAGQRFLQKFVGDWDVAKTFFSPRGGKPVRIKGTCQQTMINGGRFLRSAFVFQDGDHKTTGIGLIGFEPGNGLFTSVWTDSRGTRMSVRHSHEPFNGKEIVLYSVSLDPSGQARWKTRTLTRLTDDGNKIVHRQYLVGRDGKEQLLMELILTRKSASPSGTEQQSSHP